MSTAISKSPLVASESPHLARGRLAFFVLVVRGLGYSHAEGLALGRDHDGVVQQPVERAGRWFARAGTGPGSWSGWWDGSPLARRSQLAAVNRMSS